MKQLTIVTFLLVLFVLTGHMAVLDRVAGELLEREVLDETEFKALLGDAPPTAAA